ncbi:MAG: hypothetical protein NG712_00780 [Omnitrophica bacterium]|nr:hypothetical protein [Candidatus Omnitrophota bacterium]
MTEGVKKQVSQILKTALKIILGMAFLVLGTWLVCLWRGDVWVLIKGFLAIAVVLLGIIFLAIAKE